MQQSRIIDRRTALLTDRRHVQPSAPQTALQKGLLHGLLNAPRIGPLTGQRHDLMNDLPNDRQSVPRRVRRKGRRKLRRKRKKTSRPRTRKNHPRDSTASTATALQTTGEARSKPSSPVYFSGVSASLKFSDAGLTFVLRTLWRKSLRKLFHCDIFEKI
jgi:hypothetical protein